MIRVREAVLLLVAEVAFVLATVGGGAVAGYAGAPGRLYDVGDLIIDGATVLRDGTLTINGFDTRLLVFEAPAGQTETKAFAGAYLTHLAMHGWRPTRPGTPFSSPGSGITLVRGLRVANISFTRKQSDHVMVVLRIREKGANPPASIPGYVLREHLLPVPILPGTVYGTCLEQEMSGTGGQIVGLYRTAMPPDVIRRFYMRALRTDGWEQSTSYLPGSQVGGTGVTLLFMRNDMRLLLNVYEDPPRPGSNVMLVLQNRGTK